MKHKHECTRYEYNQRLTCDACNKCWCVLNSYGTYPDNLDDEWGRKAKEVTFNATPEIWNRVHCWPAARLHQHDCLVFGFFFSTAVLNQILECICHSCPLQFLSYVFFFLFSLLFLFWRICLTRSSVDRWNTDS